MFSRSRLEGNILFIDIETTSQAKDFADLSERMQGLWQKKSRRYQKQEPDMSPAELYFDKAGIHAEFGQVVCVSCGYVTFEGDKPQINLKSFYGKDEQQLLRDLGDMLDTYTAKANRTLCAHNGKEFDFPYLLSLIHI